MRRLERAHHYPRLGDEAIADPEQTYSGQYMQQVLNSGLDNGHFAFEITRLSDMYIICVYIYTYI